MRHWILIGILLFCFVLLGCKPSVCESDVCQKIDHHTVSYRFIDFPLFKSPKENGDFQISELLAVPMMHSSELFGLTSDYRIIDSVPNNAVMGDNIISVPYHKHSTANWDGVNKTNTPNSECIDINTAEIAQLITLPGIGQSRAESIVQARNKKPFRRKKDITKIKGISAKSYQKLQGLLCEI